VSVSDDRIESRKVAAKVAALIAKFPGKHVITPLRRRTTPRDCVRDGSTKETITVNTLCERTIWSYGTRLVVGRRISHLLLPNASLHELPSRRAH